MTEAVDNPRDTERTVANQLAELDSEFSSAFQRMSFLRRIGEWEAAEPDAKKVLELWLKMRSIRTTQEATHDNK